MPLVTVPVHVLATLQGGEPIAGADVVATLSTQELDGGFVVPQRIAAVTDDEGECVLALWPNSRGSRNSTYRVRITKDAVTVLDVQCRVPEVESCELHEIVDLPFVPPLDQAKAAQYAAQQARLLAQQDAATVSADKIAVNAAREATLEARDVALSQAALAQRWAAFTGGAVDEETGDESAKTYAAKAQEVAQKIGDLDEALDTTQDLRDQTLALTQAAQTAASMAMINSPTFTTKEEGLQAAAELGYFVVVGASDRVYATRYQKVNGEAVNPKSVPSVEALGEFVEGMEPYVYIEIDLNGTVVRTIKDDGTHAMLLPLTPESVQGQETVSNIDEVAAATVSDGGVLLSYRLLDGREVDVFERRTVTPEDSAPPRSNPSTIHADDVVKELAYGWWTHPLGVKLGSAVYGAGVGNGEPLSGLLGELVIWQKRRGGMIESFEIGRQGQVQSPNLTDSHDQPCILVDPRRDARYPLQVFQTDHNYTPTRRWRSATTNPADLVEVDFPLKGSGYTYGQVYRNPANLDELLLIRRAPGGTTGGKWEFSRSIDNGDTWATSVLVFDEEDLYLGTREAKDGNVWLLFTTHPINSSENKFLLAKFAWSGALTVPGAGEWEANVWALEAPLAPYASGAPLVVHDPAGGIARRVFDARETVAGHVEFVWAEWPTGNFAASEMKHASVNTASGEVTMSGSLGSAGKNLESGNTGGYYPGACITGRYQVAHARYDAPGEAGLGKIIKRTSADSGQTWTSETKVSVAAKVHQPWLVDEVYMNGGVLTTVPTNLLFFQQGTYTTYFSFAYDVHVIEF